MSSSAKRSAPASKQGTPAVKSAKTAAKTPSAGAAAATKKKSYGTGKKARPATAVTAAKAKTSSKLIPSATEVSMLAVPRIPRIHVVDTSASEDNRSMMANDGGQNPMLGEMRTIAAEALAFRANASNGTAGWDGRAGEQTIAYDEPVCPLAALPSVIPSPATGAGGAFSLTEAQCRVVRVIADGGPHTRGTRERHVNASAGSVAALDPFEYAPHVGTRPSVTFLCAQTGAGKSVMAAIGALQFLINHRSTLHSQLAVWSASDGAFAPASRVAPAEDLVALTPSARDVRAPVPGAAPFATFAPPSCAPHRL